MQAPFSAFSTRISTHAGPCPPSTGLGYRLLVKRTGPRPRPWVSVFGTSLLGRSFATLHFGLQSWGSACICRLSHSWPTTATSLHGACVAAGGPADILEDARGITSQPNPSELFQTSGSRWPSLSLEVFGKSTSSCNKARNQS